jgi:hypothetical protein
MKRIEIVDCPRPEAHDEEAAFARALRGALITDRQRMDFDAGRFVECNVCAVKGGTPELCGACLANRHLIGKLSR